MPERIALKRLTASDLTFFESLFRTIGAGNQKAINLNADVFIEKLYPALPGLVSTVGDVIPVTLTILGPNAAPAHVITRAITKRDAYKNWRLNGEFIRDPEGEAGRFDILSPGDIAVLEFSGDPVPKKLTLLLLASKSPADSAARSILDVMIAGGRRTMLGVTRAQLDGAAGAAPPGHPLSLVASDPEFDAALEDAAQGGVHGTVALQAKAAKPVSAAALASAKASAEKNGRDGEALAWTVLLKQREAGLWASVEWSSKANAVSSYDFRAIDAAGSEVRIDAKSTNGEFGRVIHMSSAELAAAASGTRYDLWRVYGLNEDGARMRAAENIGPVAKGVLAGLAPPKGVTVDSVSIDPGILTWGPEILIERPDEPLDGA